MLKPEGRKVSLRRGRSGREERNEQLPVLEILLLRIERNRNGFRAGDSDFEDLVCDVDDGGDEDELRQEGERRES